MDFVKRNPILTTVLALCVVAFLAESYFLWSFNSKVTASQRTLKSSTDSAKAVESISPAPNMENKAAAQKNVDELQAALNKTTATLTDTPVKVTDVPTSGPDLLVAVQSYVTNLQAKAKDKEVILPTPDFAFGLSMYIGRVSAPPVDKIPAVYTQMKVLDYILGHLVGDAKQDKQKMMITAVMRENVASGSTSTDNGGSVSDIFVVPSTVTARGPGVSALAFQIQFISYSESLRILLDDLKAFEMPLVVRNIEVEPATESSILAASGGGAAVAVQSRSRADAVADAKAPKPVVAENLSKFTLTIEYIQLPEPPKPAPSADDAAGTATPADPASSGK